MVAGECDHAVLLREVIPAITANPDTGWELLSLVDQYYRRDKISEEDFHSLSAKLRALLVESPPARKTTPSPIAPAAQIPTSEPDATAPPVTAMIGKELRNRYLQGILGHGGMGTVYAAIDRYRLDDADGGQQVAIKVLHTKTIQRTHLLEELRGEFQRLQSLSHPNIVRVHEFDRDGSLIFFTMEHSSGLRLSHVLAIRNTVALRRTTRDGDHSPGRGGDSVCTFTRRRAW